MALKTFTVIYERHAVHLLAGGRIDYGKDQLSGFIVRYLFCGTVRGNITEDSHDIIVHIGSFRMG